MTHSIAPLRVASPCVNVCMLDEARVCIGCGRHIDEIATWSQLSAVQRHEANLRADARREERMRDRHT